MTRRQASVTLTGEIQARFRADLSFRISGHVIERFVDVGFHVEPGQVLARIDPAEQQADVDAAPAAVIAAESQLRVARATFERQKTLIEKGCTTRVAFDNAQEGLRVAEGSLETAKARLGRAKDALGDTELRARAAGVITARSIEVGQVVDAAQRAFTLAQDGERDAVFDVDELAFFGDFVSRQVSLTLVSDPNVTAVGQVREVSPVLDPKGIVTPLRACGPAGGSVAKGMKKISYRGYRFPPEIIHQAIWLYLRFTLSLRDVEDLLAERGIMVSYETVRRWVNHFGPMIAADLRKRRPKPHTTWHLDEVYLKIAGRMVYLWRAVRAKCLMCWSRAGRTSVWR